MSDGWSWLLAVVASTAGTSFLLALAAYLFRSQLSHWLNKDLEGIKNQYQRELEAYKVSLIAETERVKAKQEVRKTGALRLLDKKFRCLEELHNATSGLSATLITHCQDMPASRTGDEIKDLIAIRERLSRAMYDARFFLSREDYELLLVYQGEIAKFSPYVHDHQPPYPPPPLGLELENNLFHSEIQVDEMVRRLLEELQAF